MERKPEAEKLRALSLTQQGGLEEKGWVSPGRLRVTHVPPLPPYTCNSGLQGHLP